MLDIKAIRQHPDKFQHDLARKGVDSSQVIELLEVDEQRRRLQQELDQVRAEQNEVSKQIPKLSGDEKAGVLLRMKSVADHKKKLDKDLENAEAAFYEIMNVLPNPPLDSAPDGKNDEDNVIIRTEGDKPNFDFEPKDHADLAEALDLLDTERSAKVSGSRFYYLKNELAMLQRALILWSFQEVAKRGFIPMIPPFLTKSDAVHGTGYLAHDENYIVNPGEDDLYLVATSEIPMTSYHGNEVLDFSEGPKMYVSYSPCFRREAGTYGKDTRGIFRVHQFEKVEMIIFCKPEDSTKMHELIREVEEDLLKALDLPYQVVNVCCGDLGISAAKKYDLEAWLPGQNQYREMTSTSICTDFQSRRLNIRYKTDEGKNEFVHILNGTAVSSRPLIGILENGQQSDGSVIIPEVLRPFCGFDRIDPKKGNLELGFE